MRAWVLATGLLLAACGSGEQSAPQRAAEKLNTYDVEEPAAQAPQIAYTYSYGYTLAPARIGAAQEKHVALCRDLGPARCLILQTELNRSGDGGNATTKLIVDARLAAAFGRRLDAVVADAGGEQAARSVTAEDVTKQLVDTGARIRAKEALAARLLALINGARGDVADLVAAEKAYAEVQEELDAARTLDTALRRRVAMSEIAVTYSSSAGTGTFGPVRRALSEAGNSFAGSMGAAITFAIALIPWLMIGAPFALGLRALWRRWRARRQRGGAPA